MDNAEVAKNNVMQATNTNSSDLNSNEIRGFDLNKGLDYSNLLNSYLTTGFQATNFSKAINEINRMV